MIIAINNDIVYAVHNASGLVTRERRKSPDNDFFRPIVGKNGS